MTGLVQYDIPFITLLREQGEIPELSFDVIQVINDNDFVEEEDNEFSIEDPFGNEEELIEETEDGKYQITDEGKTISKDLEVFNKNMKEQIDTVMKMANVGKFMAMDVLERVTILGNLLSSNVSNMTNHEVEKYKRFLKSELEKIKEMDSKK